MIISQNIKSHDFITGQPKHIIWWTASQTRNPCGEIFLDEVLSSGFTTGELGTVLAPTGVGKTMNFDYASLYQNVQLQHTIPERQIQNDLMETYILL